MVGQVLLVRVREIDGGRVVAVALLPHPPEREVVDEPVDVDALGGGGVVAEVVGEDLALEHLGLQRRGGGGAGSSRGRTVQGVVLGRA